MSTRGFVIMKYQDLPACPKCGSHAWLKSYEGSKCGACGTSPDSFHEYRWTPQELAQDLQRMNRSLSQWNEQLAGYARDYLADKARPVPMYDLPPGSQIEKTPSLWLSHVWSDWPFTLIARPESPALRWFYFMAYGRAVRPAPAP